MGRGKMSRKEWATNGTVAFSIVVVRSCSVACERLHSWPDRVFRTSQSFLRGHIKTSVKLEGRKQSLPLSVDVSAAAG